MKMEGCKTYLGLFLLFDLVKPLDSWNVGNLIFDYFQADVYAKPKLSYAQLIAEALMSTEERMLTLAEIYTSVADRHPFYKMDHSPNWQNAIRHNLTLNKCFTKVPRPPSEGRGSFWRLEDGAEVTIFKRIVARHQNKVKQTHIHKYDPTNDIVYVTIPSE